MRIVISQTAHDDLLSGHHFYERQATGVGDYFLDSLCSDIDALILYAGLHGRVGGYFRALSARFPYAIYYRIQDAEVQVRRVLDCRRNPVWIQKQLKKKDL